MKYLKYLIWLLWLLLLWLLLQTDTAQGYSFPCADGYNNICIAPAIEDVCWSVTSYWPFELVRGNIPVQPLEKVDFYQLPSEKIGHMMMSGDYYWNPVSWNGQADDTPTITGDGTRINPYSDNWSLVAGPIETYWRTFEFPWGIALEQHDTFGVKAYQDGVFWHHYYNQYVIGVDILSFEPIHYLECDGVIR